jgi:hypothetical protein
MYLFEFESEKSLVAKILVAADSLEQQRKEGKLKKNWTVEQLLNYFSKYDITLARKDLYNMIQKDPLKKTISNIQGDEVVFKGNAGKEPAESPPPEQSKEVVNKMAKKAMK